LLETRRQELFWQFHCVNNQKSLAFPVSDVIIDDGVRRFFFGILPARLVDARTPGNKKD
jgi:hypothetical protein